MTGINTRKISKLLLAAALVVSYMAASPKVVYAYWFGGPNSCDNYGHMWGIAVWGDGDQCSSEDGACASACTMYYGYGGCGDQYASGGGAMSCYDAYEDGPGNWNETVDCYCDVD